MTMMRKTSNMTWVEFKKWMEEQGVQDNDYLEYIDTEFYEPIIERTKGKDGLWYVSIT